MEKRLKRIETELFAIKEQLAQSQSYSENVQSSLWDNEAKQKEKNRDLSNSTNNVSNNLFNFQYAVETTISKSNWNNTTLYVADEYVLYNNILYICLMDNIGIDPSNTLYWKPANIAEELNKLKSLIKEEN